MKKLIIPTLFLLFNVVANGQTGKGSIKTIDADFINNNALEIDISKDFSDELYGIFNAFEIIMIGEGHGTMEPSIFTEKLIKLFSEKEHKVFLGLEIPENQMPEKSGLTNDSVLLKSRFFSKKNLDGRNSRAWYNLIKACSAMPNVELFFFDNFILQADNFIVEKRDSAFHEAVKEIKLKNPNSKIITLSGNLHNSLKEMPFQKTMGSFIYNDSTFNKAKILSISHKYAKGTTLNSHGKDIELRKVDYSNSIYAKSTEYNQYLLFNLMQFGKDYNCYFFTRTVNHSESL